MRFIQLLLFCLIAISCNNLNLQKVEFEVTSQQIYDEFFQNEVAAFSKYKGKRIRVTGELLRFSRVFDKNYCYIGSHGDFIGEVSCQMSDEFSRNAGNFKIGQLITIEGVVVDRSLTGVIQMQ